MSRTVEDWELSAFIDGDLPSERHVRIRELIRQSSELRDRLESYAGPHRMLGAFGGVDPEPSSIPQPVRALAGDLESRLRDIRTTPSPPDRLTSRLRQFGLLVAGGAVGWAAASLADIPEGGPSGFVDEATEIHRVLTMAPDFATEFANVDMDQLNQMFAFDINLPDIRELGLTLRRVDVSATDNGPVLVLLYEDSGHRVVSLLLSSDSDSLASMAAQGSKTRVTDHNDLAVAYGQAAGVAFAVTAPMAESRVRQIADRILKALAS